MTDGPPRTKTPGPDAPSQRAVAFALAEGLHRIRREHDDALQCEPEGVHRLRAAVRRVRSVLRTFRPMLEPEWTEAIGTELRWLADLLGAVRDLDVLEARLREAIEPDARGELDPLFVALEARRKEARDRLRDGLSSTRYQALLCRLEEAVVHPPTNPRGLEPCRTALPRRLASMWKRARREGRRLDQDASDKEFHRVRILTKRARFATEAIAPALEGSARQAADRFARQAVRLQDTLGALQDTVIAIQFVDQFTTAQPDRRPLHRAARRLVRELKRDRAKARSRFPRAWSKLDRKRNLGWAWIG